MRELATTAIVLATLTLVSPALADDKATPLSDLQPKPAPALVDAFKGMTGTWACAGKVQKLDGTDEMATKSTMTIKLLLDGFAYSGEYRVEKNAQLPSGMKGQMFWSYDTANAKLVEFFADSFGSVGHGSSDGLSDNTIVWEEDGVMMGKQAKSRTTVNRSSPNQLLLTFDVETDGKWATLGVDTCKKQ
jgi:Protein of unknown function (DUF1579)